MCLQCYHPNGVGYASSSGPTAISHDLPCSIANTMGSLPVLSSTTLAASGYSSRMSRTIVCCRNGSRAILAVIDELDPERDIIDPAVDAAELMGPLLLLIRRCDDEYATTLSLEGLRPNLGLYTCPLAELAADDLPLLSGCVAKVVVVIPDAKLPCEGCLAIDLDDDDS